MGITAAEHGARFQEITSQLDRLLQEKDPAFIQLKENLDRDLEEFRSRGFLTIAFVGEYSAGKSTLISALTGRRDLKISADIATDACKEYEWSGVHLIDTPGLWTERKDHDEKTHAAIARADLLVFCLTYSLFDTTTLANFKELAFERNYQTKMLLLVNKMSGESGDVEERIGHYTTSLRESFRPHDLSAFPISFCDARDELDGVDENDAELRALSRFDLLTTQLNQFIATKGAVARLDTPLRMVLSTLDEVVVASTRDASHDSMQALLMKKISGVVARERRSLKSKLGAEIVKLREGVEKIGYGLAQDVGVSPTLESEVRHAEVTVGSMYDETASNMQNLIDEAVKSLSAEVGKEFSGPVMTAFLAEFDDANIPGGVLPGRIDSTLTQDMKNTVGLFTKIGATVGLGSVKGGLTAAAASKTALAGGIRTIGGWVGFKFKPWQAANWAKNLTNAMPYVNVVLNILSVVSDVASEVEEAKAERNIQAAKKELLDAFFNMSGKIGEGLNASVEEALRGVFGQVEDLLAELKQSYETEIGKTNVTVKEVARLRSACHALLREI